MPRPIFWRGGHTFHRCFYHIVFVPKYRRRVLKPQLARRLTELFYDCCKTNRWYIHELAIQTDHVHLLIQLPAKVPPPQAVQYLKGGTSRIIRKEFPDLQEFLWGDSLWADGYFVETVGRASEATMRTYIQQQWAQEKPSKPRPSGRGS